MKARIEIECQDEEEFDDLRFQSRYVTKEQAYINYDREMLCINIVVFDLTTFRLDFGSYGKTIKIDEEFIYPKLDKTYVTITFTED